MNRIILFASFILLSGFPLKNTAAQSDHSVSKVIMDSLAPRHGYSNVNGISMYYEIYGHGAPLVLIHGGGSTIETNFKQIIPKLSEKYQVIAIELQAHGRTGDRPAPESFEQDADDVTALLENLKIAKADFLGFSNGGTTLLQIAIRHPEIVHKMILASALYNRSGVPPAFWGFMKQATLANMPQELKDGYLKVAHNPDGLRVMHDKDVARMINFKNIPDEAIKGIHAPTFIIIGDKDVITPEHAIKMHRLIANSELAIIPGGHGEYIGEIATLPSKSNEAAFVVPMLERFLDKPVEGQ